MRHIVAAVLVAWPAVAAAAEPARREYRVDFEAQRVTVDPDHWVLDLEGDVHVTVGRYRLSSDKLHLTRGPYGVEVDGGGRFAFCPCPDPPMSLGFSSVTLAPPTDVLIAQPTVRVGGVPVLWLPYLWLRSRDRVGLTFPRFEWRGDDGLLAGTGLHVPLRRGAPGEAPSTFELGVAGYTALGARVEAAVATPDTTSRITWDHVDESALFFDLRGGFADRDGATTAFRVDAARGPRARRAPSSLDEAARRYDRSIVSFSSSGVSSLGAGLRSDAERGGPIDDFGAWGPFAHAGMGGAIGSVGTFDGALATVTRSTGPRTESQARQLGVLSFDARPGPFATTLLVHERAEFSGREASSDVFLRAGAELDLRLPLVRRYEAVAHYVEPLLKAAATTVRLADGAASEETLLGAAGLRSVLGDWGARWGAELEIEGGFVGEPADSLDAEPILAGRAAFDARPFALSGEGAWSPDDATGAVLAAQARIGESDGVYVAGRVEAATEGEPVIARRFVRDGWAEPEAPWFDRSGVTTGAEIGVAWWPSLTTIAAADYDATHEELLGVRGLLRYRHTCACLSALAWASQRLGRPGFDAGLALDLMP